RQPTGASRLTIVLGCLDGTALKFTEQGEVRVAVAAAADGVTFTVADTGIGIPREPHDTIFEMFRQLAGSAPRRHGGAGLGLYIVRRFVQQLSGSIELASNPDRGSVFTVTL